MRSRRTFQILLLLYFSRRIIRQRKKRKHRFWIRDIFRKRPQLREMKLFHEMPRNDRVLFYGIVFEIFQSDINTTQYNFSQHLSVGHQTTCTYLHTPSRTILRHCSRLLWLAVVLRRTEKIELVPTCLRRLAERRYGTFVALRYGLLRFVTLRNFYVRACVALRCVTYCWKLGFRLHDTKLLYYYDISNVLTPSKYIFVNFPTDGFRYNCFVNRSFCGASEQFCEMCCDAPLTLQVSVGLGTGLPRWESTALSSDAP